jgi:RNA polymerase sigma factor (sigma-70 family)
MDPLLLFSQNAELARIYSAEQPSLLAHIRRKVKTAEEAEDILHDVFLELVKTYRLSRPIEVIRAFLRQVANNKIIDRGRKKQNQFEIPKDIAELFSYYTPKNSRDDSNTPEVLLLRKLIAARLQNALAELPEEQRLVFIRHELEGKSFLEIEQETGVNVNTLLSRKRYALLFIRNRMKDLYDDLRS